MFQDTPSAPGLRIIGLLGGVGAGKSAVAELLAELIPAHTFDADDAVADLLADPEIAVRVEVLLGKDLRTREGSLDRQALSDLVFQDSSARQELERLLHPLVRARCRAELAALEGTGSPEWAVLDVPLLVEGGLDRACSLLLFIDAPPERRSHRVARRSGWDREEWERREAAQADLAEKRSRADAILKNDGDLDDLRSRLVPLIPRLRDLPPIRLVQVWPGDDLTT